MWVDGLTQSMGVVSSSPRLPFYPGLSLSSPRLASSCCHCQWIFDVAKPTLSVSRQHPYELTVYHNHWLRTPLVTAIRSCTTNATRNANWGDAQASSTPRPSSFRRQGKHSSKDEHGHHHYHHRLSIVGERWLHCMGLPSLLEVITCGVYVISLIVVYGYKLHW